MAKRGPARSDAVSREFLDLGEGADGGREQEKSTKWLRRSHLVVEAAGVALEDRARSAKVE